MFLVKFDLMNQFLNIRIIIIIENVYGQIKVLALDQVQAFKPCSSQVKMFIEQQAE